MDDKLNVKAVKFTSLENYTHMVLKLQFVKDALLAIISTENNYII